MKNKRGELTTQQLVVIIILILSFVIILFLLFRLNLGETSNKEICHNSVVMVGKGFGELDCNTNYVCISGGKDCEGFNYDYKINVDLKKEDEEIIPAIQKEIEDCDWMFGDGKINYVSSKIPIIGAEIPTLHYYCAICSTIKFSEDIKDFEFEDNLINTNEKYSIVTGMDANLGTDDYLPAQIIQSSDVGSTYCNKFISKA